ncbi:hypothetical protein [Streptomyces sp. NRRL B-24085]|uniref:hypothetical protein n=1 Tax=Streptomyces sp. NRRL B-24085 TaxID=1709476 RepID=UPI00131EB452|nr:hypothetical protein [Streptomyces sp. NRRL B-24085]
MSHIFQTSGPVRISADQGWRALHAGDIVFLGAPSNMHHAAIYIGNGLIAEARFCLPLVSPVSSSRTSPDSRLRQLTGMDVPSPHPRSWPCSMPHGHSV